jgi:FkbM family methyltransferase
VKFRKYFNLRKIVRHVHLRRTGLDDFYKYLARGITLLDIGASYFFAARWGQLLSMSPSRLVLVDPNAKSLKYTDNLPDSLDIIKIESAVSHYGGAQVLYQTNVKSGSSLLQPNLNFLKSAQCPEATKSYFLPIKKLKLETISIKTLLEESLGQTFFLKIDIQGYELELLKGAKSFLQRGHIVLVEVETSLVRNPVMLGAARLPEVIDLMSRYGYQILDLNPVYEEVNVQGNKTKLGELGECDITFIADPRETKFQSPEKLVAIFVGYIIYGYPVLAHRLLSENIILKTEFSERGFNPEKILKDLLKLPSN